MAPPGGHDALWGMAPMYYLTECRRCDEHREESSRVQSVILRVYIVALLIVVSCVMILSSIPSTLRLSLRAGKHVNLFANHRWELKGSTSPRLKRSVWQAPQRAERASSNPERKFDPKDPDMIYILKRQEIATRMVEGAVLGAIGASSMELAAITAGAAEVAFDVTMGQAAVEVAAGFTAAEVTASAASAAAGVAAVSTATAASTMGLANTAVSLVGGYILAFGTGSLRMDMLAGIIAVTVATLVTHPMDTVKSRLQAGKNPIGSKGFSGLYHGLLYSIVKKCPETSIYIAIYHGIRETLLKRALTDARMLPDVFLKCMVVSSVAGALAASIIKVPFEVIGRQMQVGNASSGRQLLRKLFTETHARTFFFVSWLAVLLRDIPKGGLQFGVVYVLELLGHGFMATTAVPEFFQRMIYAAIAGGAAAFLTTPLDVLSLKIMTRLQADMQHIESQKGVARAPPVVESLKNILAEIWNNGGIFGFWRGALLRTATYVPGSCIFYAIFETLVALKGGH